MSGETKNMEKVLGVDFGFGSVKVTYGDTDTIEMMYKSPSVVSEVDVNEHISDNRVVNYKGKSYYVGDDALLCESSKIIDINTYDRLEYFTPVLLSKVLLDVGCVPETIVSGLSVAHIDQSGHFKESLSAFLGASGASPRIKLLPQGYAAKLTIDKYGINFPAKSKVVGGNYMLADIGFNTLDICRVIDGKASTSLLKGIPGKGAVVMATQLQSVIKEELGYSLTISETADCLMNGSVRRRGVTHDLSEYILKVREEYASMLYQIVEDEFGQVLDKVDNFNIIGGGSYTLAPPSKNSFIVGPAKHAEFYNSIAYYIHGCD